MKKRNAKEDFIIAFWELYQKKRIEKISIRELCEVAGYNRSTFYTYFKDIFDLLDKFVEQLILPPINEFIYINIDYDFNSFQRILLSTFEKNNKYIRELIKNNHNYVLEEKVKEKLIPIIKEKVKDYDLDMDYIIRYQFSAVLGVLKFWYQEEENRVSEEELSKILFKISNEGVLNIIKKRLDNN